MLGINNRGMAVTNPKRLNPTEWDKVIMSPLAKERVSAQTRATNRKRADRRKAEGKK